MSDQLFPRPPRRMRQPKKETLREELARSASTIEQQRIVIEHLRQPWWRRLLRKTA